MVKRNKKSFEDKEFEERVLTIRRVSKKTTGGNYVSFSALVAVGDGKGNVGVGLGRGLEVPPAIQKGITQARKRMVFIPIYNETLPHEIIMKYKSARLLLKPAPPGTGLKLGGVVRAVLDIAGVNNASGKIRGSRNQITNAYAVIEAIKKLKPRISKGKHTPPQKAAVEESTNNSNTEGEKAPINEVVKSAKPSKVEKIKEEKKQTAVKKVPKKPIIKKSSKAKKV